MPVWPARSIPSVWAFTSAPASAVCPLGSDEYSKLKDKGPPPGLSLYHPHDDRPTTPPVQHRHQVTARTVPAMPASLPPVPPALNAAGRGLTAPSAHGYADAILAGGSEAAITPMGFAGFINCMALSTSKEPAAASIPFDKRRGGFVMGEGAGAPPPRGVRARQGPRGQDLRAKSCGYGCHLRRVSCHRPPHPEAEGGAPAPSAWPWRKPGKRRTRARVLHQRPRHQHPPQRQGGDRRHQEGLRRRTAYRVLVSSTKSHDRPYAGRGRRRWRPSRRCMALRDGVAPPTIGSTGAGSGLRPRLCAPTRPARRRWTWRCRCPWASAGTTPASPSRKQED